MTASPIRIRLLGPVEVVDGMRSAPLGGPRMRTLIGALALCAPDVVSRDTLVEGVWDNCPPAGAEKTLRAHVAYLRRRLVAEGFGELIGTRAPGYLLTVPVEQVDVHVFQELVAHARTAADPASSLRVALGLWRGDVLAGCPAGEWIRAEATRLHEIRLNAIEELFAADLAVGRHAGAAAELEAMVARYPLRERLWELLMRALYLAGRQGEALQAYRRARSRLVSEIGLEPGAELRRLEAAILAGQEVPAGAAAPVVMPLPREVPDVVVPTPLTRLVGRRAELAELTALLADRRLITLTGVGGCGKTRLAIALVERVGSRFADGVRFVDLAPLTDPSLVAGAVADGFELAADGGGRDALLASLRHRECLLVLDNCEHLVPACAELVCTLLRFCPSLRVIATSREALGVIGEVVWPVPPLSCPPPSGKGGLAMITRYDAVRLFLDRSDVSAVRELTDEDAPGISALCGRLDGLPLAIELAAARTSVLTVAEITGRLHDPLLLSASRHPDRPDHRAMHTTIAWSYDLLDPSTQDCFRRLAVFSGGFTLAAAEAVWPSGCVAVDVLADLVAKSLVVVERTPAGTRYRLLETIGHWVTARLAESPTSLRDARSRHAAYYLKLAEEADRQLRHPETRGWLARLSADYENLRSALGWFDDPVGQLRLALALVQYWQFRGRYGEGRRWLENALADSGSAPDHLVGRALWATAGFALLTCDYADAQRLGERALTAQRAAGDLAGEANTLRLLASVARERGDYPAALAVLDHALASPVGGAEAVGAVLSQIGFTCWLAGELDRAEHALTACLRWCERIGDPVRVASAQVHLAAVAVHRGSLPTASRMASESLARFTELDVKEGIAWSWDVLGLAALRAGRCAEAVASLRNSLEVHSMVGDRWRQASVLDSLAWAMLEARDPIRAAELSGLATAIRDTLGVPIPTAEFPSWAHTQAELTRTLPEATRLAAMTRGANTPVPEVIASLKVPELAPA